MKAALLTLVISLGFGGLAYDERIRLLQHEVAGRTAAGRFPPDCQLAAHSIVRTWMAFEWP